MNQASLAGCSDIRVVTWLLVAEYLDSSVPVFNEQLVSKLVCLLVSESCLVLSSFKKVGEGNDTQTLSQPSRCICGAKIDGCTVQNLLVDNCPKCSGKYVVRPNNRHNYITVSKLIHLITDAIYVRIMSRELDYLFGVSYPNLYTAVQLHVLEYLNISK